MVRRDHSSIPGILELVTLGQHLPDRGSHSTFALAQARVSTILWQPRRSNIYFRGLFNRRERIALHSCRYYNCRSMRNK